MSFSTEVRRLTAGLESDGGQLADILKRRKPRSIDDLREMITSDSEDAGTSAAWLLGRLKGESVSEISQALLTGLNSTLARVRSEAARSFSNRPAKEALQILPNLLQNDPDVDVRAACAYSLGRMRFTEARNSLVGKLSDNKEASFVRGMAAESLGLLGGNDDAVLTALMNASFDRELEVAIWAARALSAIAPYKLTDVSEQVRSHFSANRDLANQLESLLSTVEQGRLTAPERHGQQRRPTGAKSYKELKAQIDKLQQEAELVRAHESTVVIANIRKLMNEYRINASDLGISTLTSRRKSSPIKFRDPETGFTWSGRGREPTWIKGKDRTKYAVRK